MAYLKWIIAVFLVLAFVAYWKLSSIKFYGEKLLNFRNKVFIALTFPILLVFLIFFGSLIFLIILGILVLVLISYLVFFIFGRGKIYYKKY